MRKIRRSFRRLCAWLLFFSVLFSSSVTESVFAVELGGVEEQQEESVELTESEEQIEAEEQQEESAEQTDTETDGEAVLENGEPEEEPQEDESAEEEIVAEEEATDSVDEQYHFEDGVISSIITWKELYLPSSYEDLLGYDEDWWDGLYDYERDLAEFLVGKIVELDDNVYQGQSVEECIEILESGVEATDFFQGTIFVDLTLDDLYALRDAGSSLDDLYEEIAAQASRPKLRASAGTAMAVLNVANSGYSGTGHGTIWKMTLGGEASFCLSMGKNARRGYMYSTAQGTYEVRDDGIGALVSLGSRSVRNYVCAQIAIWLYQTSQSYTESEVTNRATAMLNLSASGEMEDMVRSVWEYYNIALTGSQSYYVFYSDNTNAQTLATAEFPSTTLYEAPGSQGSSGDILIRVVKTDWQTEAGLEGCEIGIYEDGTQIATVTTDENGEATYAVEKTAAELANASFEYSIKEITAPEGYTWQEEEVSETVTGPGTYTLELQNERTLGAVELVKYDNESESGTRQGDAVLDGAVYGIYAAEDIEHQDGLTGLLYEEGDLVDTQTIGRSPKQDSDGYILNTDGSRHIENPSGTIRYEDTPGRTLFGDLELGSYYIKEITPAEGYMLDEATYDVTFTYKDQMVKVETRDETAGEAQNELTADDGSGSHTVYSGDYVIKQGFQFIKTSDNTYQTELSLIEGAGFCVYLISDLSGVQSGAITPVGTDWSVDDVMTFYDYDFTDEPTATVYKRTGHEEWTDGDVQWLVKVDGLNKYQVGEMFTDADGRIVTPELPYGTYVVVETTTPEYHVAAKPFLVSITQDGGVLYTDDTKQTIEKSYTYEESIRYGDHALTKDREGRVLQKQRIINNTITKTFLRLVKADEEFLVRAGTYIEAEEVVRGTVLKEGSTYRLRCVTLNLSRESLDALNWIYDADGYLSYYDPNARWVSGTEEHPFTPVFLRENGELVDCYITLPQELPVGSYELTELTAPEGYVVNGSEQTVVDTSSGRVNGYEIQDTPRRKDVFTIDNGCVYPDGQMGTNKYALCDEYGNLTVTVLQRNQEQKGIIEIRKHGEQLAKATGTTVFTYEDAPVEGAEFQIVAAEDIYTQELAKDLLNEYAVDASEYRIYQAGDVVATITTDRNGWGYAAGLYIGKYRIQETVAGDGFVLNPAVTEFEITPQTQTVNFDFHDAVYENERQRLEITVEKTDSETGESLAGAVYGLYAAEDIYTKIVYDTATKSWIVRDTPELLIEAGKLIATCVTDADGHGCFDADLPLAEYTVKELKAPEGYWGTLTDVTLDGSYDSATGGQNVEFQSLCAEFANEKTKLWISKRDIANEKELPGATLEIYNEKNILVTSWVSSTKPHYIEKLPVGKYRLVERSCPQGYGYAEDVEFEIKENGEIQTVVMYDDAQEVDVEKSTISSTQRNAVYEYTIDVIRNQTDDELTDFTVTDSLPPQVRITELWTGTYSDELTFTVEFQVNGSDVWTTWAENISTKTSAHLTAPYFLAGT